MADTGNIITTGSGPALPPGNGHHRVVAESGGENGRIRILPHLERAFEKQWKVYRKKLKRSRKKFSEKAIHRSRITTRRLLATVALLGGFVPVKQTEKVETCLKRHLDAFDDLRDTQVQLKMVRKMTAYSTAVSFREYLRKREGRFVREIRREIRALKTKRLRRLVRCCLSALKKQRRSLTAEAALARVVHLIDSAYQRTGQLRSRVDVADAQTIHRARIAFKRFRYMLEALAAFLPGIGKELLEEMHEYQNLMGQVQDHELLVKAFQKFVRKRQVVTEAAEPLMRELLRRRQTSIDHYLAKADELANFWREERRAPALRVPKSIVTS